jgi:hypothetical protein
MSQAITDKIEEVVVRTSAFTASLAQIRDESQDVEIGKETPKEELNAIFARYPTTNEVKG